MEKGEIGSSIALTGGLAFASLVRTAVYEHRILTHRSLEVDVPVETAFRVAGAHLADAKRWAAVHRVHHSTPDANLLPFIELVDLVEWREGQSSSYERMFELPDVVEGFDPAAKTIPFKEALKIGRLARTLVDGKYRPPENYHISDVSRILYSKQARFRYEDRNKMKKDANNAPIFNPDRPPSLEEIRFLLRDPHAPALHERGIPGILLYNVPLYGYAERSFADAAFRPTDLSPDQLDETLRENRAKLRIAYVGLVAALNLAMKRPSTLAKAAYELLVGGAVSGAAVAALINGGNLTNALGHGGDWSQLTFKDFLDGKVYPKSDGTYTTNSKLMAAPTLDEVGGQDEHHDDPSLIAYTKERGVKKVVSAPFGSGLEALTKKSIVFRKGNGFPELDQRPDLPSEAVLVLQGVRRTYLKNNIT
ncbi:MAG: hypothetical protein M3Q79_01155 [bacterium]|nr:hypothetical protein [bacterium]